MLAATLLLAVAVSAYKNELILHGDDKIGFVVKTPVPNIPASDLPDSLDYRLQGLLTTDLNQHIPVYCGSCWAHAPLSSIADRIKIQTKGLQRDVVPSVQALINCGDAGMIQLLHMLIHLILQSFVGDCNGGDSNAANAWVYKNGIPDITCQQYQAKNMACSDINTCMNCSPSTGCSAQYNYTRIQISEYGGVTGDDNIRSEILARGPVSAYINANCIEDYTGGINMYDTCVTKTT